MDSTFDLALPFGEMAMYAAQHGDREAARQWIRQAFAESAAGIDYRMMRSGMFEPALIVYADSLQSSAYRRVSATAASEPKR